jgi:hypothetical protein
MTISSCFNSATLRVTRVKNQVKRDEMTISSCFNSATLRVTRVKNQVNRDERGRSSDHDKRNVSATIYDTDIAEG